MKLLMTHTATEIKSCFVIRVPRKFCGRSPKRFRDPFGASIAAKVVAGLRALGYQATDQKPGKACDACFKIMFPGFCIDAIFLVRGSAEVECIVLTACRRSWLARISSEEMTDRLASIGTSIHETLRNEPDITSLLWLTHSQAEKYFAETPHFS